MQKVCPLTKEFLEEEFLKNKKSLKQISQETHYHVSFISQKIKKFGLKPHNSLKYLGKRYGHVIIIEYTGQKNYSHMIFKCKCDCGATFNAVINNIVSHKDYSCGCVSRKRGKDHPNFAGYEEIGKSIWWTIKNGAESRGIKLEITMKDIWELFLKQNRRCALTGVELTFAPSRKTSKQTTASLDRIDSSKDYTLDNVQWVHKAIQLMKMQMHQEDFIKWCKLVGDFNKDKV
jgi:hypothetical protein